MEPHLEVAASADEEVVHLLLVDLQVARQDSSLNLRSLSLSVRPSPLDHVEQLLACAGHQPLLDVTADVAHDAVALPGTGLAVRQQAAVVGIEGVLEDGQADALEHGLLRREPRRVLVHRCEDVVEVERPPGASVLAESRDVAAVPGYYRGAEAVEGTLLGGVALDLPRVERPHPHADLDEPRAARRRRRARLGQQRRRRSAARL
mmetsp:Transcript_95316/g.240143  ORF Transcript_95316/g.240143 Transcript_95316/m.240143 type:complete len:205 (+) Transcript_95316:3447-4061(+)